MQNDFRSRLKTLAVLCAPILLVKAASLVMPHSPRHVAAAVPTQTVDGATANSGLSAIAPVPELPDPPSNTAAREHAQQLLALLDAPSPFYHPPRVEPTVVVFTPEVEDEEEILALPPVLEVQAFVSGLASIVLIDGAYYRTGAVVDDTWYITHIDVVNRSVELTDATTGRVHRIVQTRQ